MKPHTKIYLQAFGFDISDFIPCECCNAKGIDIHHIESRGMGGTKKADTIDNLMALCRECHSNFGDKKQYKEYLKNIHQHYLKCNITLKQKMGAIPQAINIQV